MNSVPRGPIQHKVPVSGKPGSSAVLVRGEEILRRVERKIAKRFNLPKGTVSANPLEYCLTIVAGFWPEDVTLQTVPGSENDPTNKPPDHETRLEAAKVAIRYIQPQLAAMEVTGPGGGPIPIAGAVIDIVEMMKIPGLRAKVEDLQMEMARMKRAEEQPKALPSPDTLSPEQAPILDAEFESVEPTQEN